MGFRGGMHQSTLRSAFLQSPKGKRAPFTLVRGPTTGSAGARSLVCLVTRANTPPPVPAPRTRAEALARARELVPTRGPPAAPARRTLVGDARDLLRRVALESTGALLDARNADAAAFADGSEMRDLVHLGWSPWVRELLSSVWSQVDPVFRDVASARVGDPRGGFDSDGFIHLVVHDASRRHLIVLGGSDYGTYYGVATLLERSLGVRWVFPGPDGEVIPRSPSGWELEGDLNWYEEPDYRGRSMDLLAGGVAADLPEVDAIRTWALNSRLNPTDERVYIFSQTDPVARPTCAAPQRSISRVEVGKESRIPADHALHALMSPWEPSLDADLEAIGERHPAFYPDVRPRISWGGDAPAVVAEGVAPLPAGLHPAMGAPLARSSLRITWIPTTNANGLGGLQPDDLSCQPEGAARGSLYATWPPGAPLPPERAPSVIEGIEVASTLVPSGAARTAAQTFGYGMSGDSGLSAFYRGHFVAITELGAKLRFIPWAYRSSVNQRFDPDPNDWKPCVYGDQPLTPGLVPEPSGALVAFLVTRVNRQAVALSVGSPRDEVCVSVAPSDGAGWCQCDACSMSGTSSANIVGGNLGAVESTQIRMRAGLPLFREVPNEDLAPGSPGREASEQRGVLTRPRWLDRADPPSVDAAASQGLFATWCCRDGASRRVVDLTRALAEASWAARYDEMYLTTHAYNVGRGAPMSADISAMLSLARTGDGGCDRSLPTYVGDQALVYLTSTSDLWEYQRTIPTELSLAQLQNRYPRTFNEMRWSVMTRQHGLYEYMYGGQSYVTPRLYSRSLHRALTRAHGWRARAFNAETLPMWGVEGPKWFEVAQMLWSLSGSPDAMRARWSEAVATSDAGEVIPGVARALHTIFDELERRWSEAVAAAEETNTRRRLDELTQPGLTGPDAPAQLDALDGFAPGARSWLRGVTARCDLLEAMEVALAAMRGVGPTAARARRRVEFLHAGLEPCSVLTQASRPIRVLRRWLREASMMDALPAEGTPEFGVFLESIRILDAWFVDPSRYVSDLHGAFQASLRRHGLVVDGASARELSVRGAGEEVLARHWLVLDRRSLQNYCARWNAALVPSAPGFSAEAFGAGSMLPIAAMFNAIGGWARAFIDAFANLRGPEVPGLLLATWDRFNMGELRTNFTAVA